ncbi:RNB domain-containing ribonuclease [Sphingomonas sp. ID1715]|uniref:ribonuclease R family protein n=1 Tax=Sphingomonas sp. ID1715 TaxID=1656898 RepID=UPI001488F54F|nr:RNB domain-containing ribonuclease [Sphingomonas sp. ID1715]NNM77348.1 RNB domain-containing ribonuclease [Sphingomonas sp. ID1715]
MPKPKRVPGLPSREQILDFIATSDAPAGKREIARAFGLHGADKVALKALLKDMADEGLIDSAPGRAFHKMGGIPKVTVLRIVDVDEDGQAWAVPEQWQADAPAPKLRIRERKKQSALGVGDRVLSRTEEAGKGWIAHPMKKLARGEELMLGVLHKEGERWFLQGVEKRERRDFPVSDHGDAAVGDLVLAEKTGRPPRIAARVVERLGDPFEPRSFSLIAIHRHGIPHLFREDLLEEAERMAKLPLGQREDLRHLPIVAIDPVDARDHDDAVWAEETEQGWNAIVAIADVSFYVRPGSQLDREARKRGNSVYFPDRVVPMLPETLSANVCSLKEGVDRAALACHMTIGKDGQLKTWRFTRAVVRIARNIAYEDAQAAIDDLEPLPFRGGDGGGGERLLAQRSLPHPNPSPEGEGLSSELVRSTLVPLWACWRAMYKARAKREPLELDLPERRVVLDEKGRIMSVAPRERLDAHKLIEDYMIAANVAAAKALEAKKAPVMYRDHEPPSREKLVALKDYLKTFDLEFALGQVIKPGTFNRIIERVGDAEFRPQVMEQILRTQTQAYYGPENAGHFGLALGSYAHFTSPIRRYADLIVHRSLVGAYGLEPEVRQTALTAGESEAMDLIGEAISRLERRAMEAERETVDRYVAAYLSERVGELVETRITGVQPFGFFATVEGLGGDGLVPVSTLGTEYFRYDEASQTLTGEDTETRFAPGQRLTLRLAEANPVTGSLRFELAEGGTSRPQRSRTDRTRPMKRRGRPANIRHKSRA